MTLFVRFSVIAMLVATFLVPQGASARAIRFDTVLDFCRVERGATAAIPIAFLPFQDPSINTAADCTDPTFADPFSVRLGDTFYDTLYINNDGVLTFAEAYAGGALDLSDLAQAPVIAPFFTDTPFSDGGGGGIIGYGGNNANRLTPFLSINYLNGNSGSNSRYQVNILDRSGDTGQAGDFDLELNYFGDGGIRADQGGARVGFNNGAGQFFEAPGSGVAGAFLGDPRTFAECADPSISPLALACVNAGTPEVGGYLFAFRNGYALGVPGQPVPAPGSLALLIAGIALIRMRK